MSEDGSIGREVVEDFVGFVFGIGETCLGELEKHPITCVSAHREIIRTQVTVNGSVVSAEVGVKLSEARVTLRINSPCKDDGSVNAEALLFGDVFDVAVKRLQEKLRVRSQFVLETTDAVDDTKEETGGLTTTKQVFIRFGDSVDRIVSEMQRLDHVDDVVAEMMQWMEPVMREIRSKEEEERKTTRDAWSLSSFIATMYQGISVDKELFLLSVATDISTMLDVSVAPAGSNPGLTTTVLDVACLAVIRPGTVRMFLDAGMTISPVGRLENASNMMSHTFQLVETHPIEPLSPEAEAELGAEDFVSIAAPY